MAEAGRFQFSIGMLLAMTGVVALVVWATTGQASVWTNLAILLLVPGMIAFSLIGYRLGNEHGKAFCLGALCQSSLACLVFYCALLLSRPGGLSGADFLDLVEDWRGALASVWAGVVPLGLICVGFRWLIVRYQQASGR